MKKVWEVHKATLWLESRGSSNTESSKQVALVRMPSLSVAAFLPLYAIIEGKEDTEGRPALKGTVHVTMQHLSASVCNQQVVQLHDMLAALKSLGKCGKHCWPTPSVFFT